MDCPYCANKVPLGVAECPTCGAGLLAPPSDSSGHRGEVYSSAPAEVDPNAYVPDPNDPEANLHTQLVSAHDRQEQLETRVVEGPVASAAAPNPTQKPGLPDSRVSRGVEDTFLEGKRILLRLGRVGRIAFLSHVLVVIGAVFPWFYRPYVGYTPGVEHWGWIPLLFSVAAMATLLWRHKQRPTARVIPVLLHLALTAGLVLSLLWMYRETMDLEQWARPSFSIGVYITGLGAAGAGLGALLGIKDVR